MQAVSARVKELEPEVARLEAELDDAAARRCRTRPIRPPPTRTPSLREWGDRARAAGRDHLELAGAMIDMEAGSKVSGPRFAFLKGDLVFLELALVRWVMEVLRGHGFEPVIPPVLVKEEALFGTGFLPDTEQQIYRLADDPLFLTGTSEVPLASLHAGEIMDERAAPLRRVLALLPARGGRRGQGHARHLPRAPVRQGRDVRVRRAGGVGGRARAAAGDRGGDPAGARRSRTAWSTSPSTTSAPRAVKKYDLEAWLPSQQRYRELTSTSNTTDFQSRRLDIRYRPDGGKPEHVHTLNGTAVAVGRDADRADGEPPDRGRRRRRCPHVLQQWGAPARLG